MFKPLLIEPESGFSLDVSGMGFSAAELEAMAPRFAAAASEMKKIEAGEIKNPDENRKVTHFGDRAEYTSGALFAEVERFSAGVREGRILSGTGKKFEALVVNGIGGSALGPQLMQFAINGPYWNELSSDRRCGALKVYFLDNTDSAEFVDLMQVMDPETTLQLVISKSGGTRETKNNMIAMEAVYAARGLDFGANAVAITMKGSDLDKHARENRFLAVFEMAESIGGRTSETSIVGHVPATLCGIDFERFLAGACAMDEWTRAEDPFANPAMILAASWYLAGNGRGDRNMVIVPYSDRLILLSRYLQQLVMESLGKELDLDGNVVHQGLNVFGNKGGTDAHAFIQQLNDGRDDFFATFIEVLTDAERIPVGDQVCIGDYLHGFLAGLNRALRRKNRRTIMVKIAKLSEFELGQIVALYERAVAIYAEFIHINAFHQPGVQAYKKAANNVLALADALREFSGKNRGFSGSAADFAAKIGASGDAFEVGGLLDKAVFNGAGIDRRDENGDWVYSVK
ncbi:MAG: hypothetical protein MJ016_01485 [Victivallaceae bacterium]|nr:hypothetical protein [Victivallaceae bacterium]